MTRLMLMPGGQGGRICLIDRWFNPTDLLVSHYAMCSLTLSGDGLISDNDSLQVGRWYELRFEWDDSRSGSCRFYVDGVLQRASLPLNRPGLNGISYVHLQSAATESDSAGFLVESVEAEVFR